MKKLMSLLLALMLSVGLFSTVDMQTKAAEPKVGGIPVGISISYTSPLQGYASNRAFAEVWLTNTGSEPLDLSQYVITCSVGGNKGQLRVDFDYVDELVVNETLGVGEKVYLMMAGDVDVEDVVMVQGSVTVTSKDDATVSEQNFCEFYTFDVDDAKEVLSFRLKDDTLRYDRYRLRWETDAHCSFQGLIYGGDGDAIEIDETDGGFCIPFLSPVKSSGMVIAPEEGYVLKSVELVPADAGTIERQQGVDRVFHVTLNKPATIKATSAPLGETEDVLLDKTGTDLADDVKLVIDETECTSEKNFLISKLGVEKEQMEAYDFSLIDGVGNKINDGFGKVKVSLPIPEGWTASGLVVYYVNAETGKMEDMNAVVDADGKHITFTTDHFSTYILVNKNKEEVKPGVPSGGDDTNSATDKNTKPVKPSNVPQTGDIQNMGLWTILALCSVVLFVAVISKKRRAVR